MITLWDHAPGLDLALSEDVPALFTELSNEKHVTPDTVQLAAQHHALRLRVSGRGRGQNGNNGDGDDAMALKHGWLLPGG